MFLIFFRRRQRRTQFSEEELETLNLRFEEDPAPNQFRFE